MAQGTASSTSLAVEVDPALVRAAVDGPDGQVEVHREDVALQDELLPELPAVLLHEALADEGAAPVGDPVGGGPSDDRHLVEDPKEGFRLAAEAGEHVLGAVVDVLPAEPVQDRDLLHAGKLRDPLAVGLRDEVREGDLVPHDEAVHPLSARGSASRVARSVPRTQMTKKGRTIEPIVRIERVFFRKRLRKT